ncbi:MAG: OB-fold nucleic acid binding domain-containing protein [Arachnia sp.]
MPDTSLAERLRGLFVPQEELEARELREQATDAGAQTLASCPPRSRVTLRGTIVSVTSDAENGWLEAELNDGSGTVRLIWMGRSRIGCLLPGHTLRVSGRLATVDGGPAIYNPDYEIL